MRTCLALSLLVITAVAAESAAAGGSPAHTKVTPTTGAATTRFVVAFTVPDRTGRFGVMQRHDRLVATARRGRGRCIQSFAVRAPNVAAGTRVRVELNPARLGGRWCSGVYRGQFMEITAPVCNPPEPCPEFASRMTVIGRFRLNVS